MICQQLIQLPDDTLQPPGQWRPYPRCAERAGWESLPEATRAACIAAGERWLGEPWPPLPATEILAFRRDGNRRRYETPYFARRYALVALVLAECCEGRGRFIDEIVNGLWCLCEETSWCLPAHIGGPAEHAGLPDPLAPVVDLFAAESGSLVAWTLYLLGDELGAVSALLPARLRREIEQRIIEPALAHDDYWWMGLDDPGRMLNNWTPWIVSNWLACALLADEQAGRRTAAVYKAAGCLDRFLARMPADGGCDEGPSYWGRAAASVLDALEILKSASRGALDFYGDPLIQALGRYMVAVHIADTWFVNFADASARFTPPTHSVYGYGVRTGDNDLMQLGAYLCQQAQAGTRGAADSDRDRTWRLGLRAAGGQAGAAVDFGSDLNRALQALFRFPITLAVETPPPMVRDAWLPDTQVVTARDRAGSAEGWFVAAKGGHNAESHNHNDIGSFIVFHDGAPLIVDAGVGEYTRQTFSPERYKIWTMRSSFHSLLPVLDGVEQLAGAAYRARDVAYEADDARMRFTLDLRDAYPPEARIGQWRREIELVRGDRVTVTDHYTLTADVGEIAMVLLTPSAPSLEAGGRVRLESRMLPGAVASANGMITVEAEGVDITLGEIPLDDTRLSPVWGKRLHTIRLVMRRPARTGRLRFTFTFQAPVQG